ncbi:hypothetical protein NDU88_012274 [Pleurodeles waltl]|uniref:Uncharacterized protein n=1 Tax=Pleurodeles waltl TaxID=8319 RepID=A0AAV7R3Q8_PLEWA|nr:hypothetical protein NDU88_012274 [Pleurodeles waltl]
MLHLGSWANRKPAELGKPCRVFRKKGSPLGVRLRAVLLDAQSQRVFMQMEKKTRASDDLDVFKHSLEDLDAHYQPIACVAVDRFHFFQRKQGKDETVDEKNWVCGDAPMNEIIAIVKKAELSKRCTKAALSNGTEDELPEVVRNEGVRGEGENNHVEGENNQVVLEEVGRFSKQHETPSVATRIYKQNELPPVATCSGRLIAKPKVYQDSVLRN